MGAFPFPIAPLPEQRRIVGRIDELFAEIAEGEAALAEARKGLDLFRRSLLKAAVTGEITREWRETYRPAETGATCSEASWVAARLAKFNRDAAGAAVQELPPRARSLPRSGAL